MRSDTTEKLLLLAMFILGVAMGGSIAGYIYKDEMDKAERNGILCEYQLGQLQSKCANDSILLGDYQQAMQLVLQKYPDGAVQFERIMDSINTTK